MGTYHRTANILVRAPSAFIPIAMSSLALVVVLGKIILFGIGQEPDEGAAAHLFQLLVAGQIPFIAWCVLRRLRSYRTGALTILGLQAVAIGVALLPVWYYRF